MPQVFKLAILNMQNDFVEIPAGGKLEIDFIESLVTRCAAKGVGFFKTQKQVEETIRQEATALLSELKFQSRKAM